MTRHCWVSRYWWEVSVGDSALLGQSLAARAGPLLPARDFRASARVSGPAFGLEVGVGASSAPLLLSRPERRPFVLMDRDVCAG